MTKRERAILSGFTAVTILIVVGLLLFSIVQTQKLTRERAAASLRLSKQNAEVLAGVADILEDVRSSQGEARRAQVDQRKAFRVLARRNEELHGRDPDEAPDFRSFDRGASEPKEEPSGVEPSRNDKRDKREKRENGERRPPRKTPRPAPSPTPSPPGLLPKICVGDICIND